MEALLRKIDDAVCVAERWFITGAFVTMVALIFTQVILRYVFNTGLHWAEELARYLLIYAGFLGASIATKDRRHIVIDALPRAFPPGSPAVAFLGMLSNLISAGFCVFLVWVGWDFASRSMEMGRASTSMELPLWIIQAAIPMASAIMAARFTGFAVGEFLIMIGRRERVPHGIGEGLGELLTKAGDEGASSGGDEPGDRP
ncbi:MAG: TRAP transporter small permease [Myxococcales bacterium]|nr:TRAP transporter small permease [Myxococcales bacterium]